MSEPAITMHTIKDIVLAVQQEFSGEISEKKARKLADAVLHEVTRGLLKKRILEIDGFGVFTLLRAKERIGINPHTGEHVRSPATVTVTFQPAETFEAALDPDPGDNPA
jgi:DNA-binding protein HU-beta